MNKLQATVARLEAMPRVLAVIVLDAGLELILILSTGGYSTFKPTQGVRVISEQDAFAIAESYWHTATLTKIIKELRNEPTT